MKKDDSSSIFENVELGSLYSVYKRFKIKMNQGKHKVVGITNELIIVFLIPLLFSSVPLVLWWWFGGSQDTTLDGKKKKKSPNQAPPPHVPHQILDTNAQQRVIVIGDVHGCLEELIELLQKLNVDHDNDIIILVGDLVNKGPSSAETISYVRRMKNAYSVRGNHDEAALKAYFNENYSGKYSWVQNLSKENLDYLIQLPYTIRLPRLNALVVHAGLDPRTVLCDQDTESMVTMREIDDRPWAKVYKGEFGLIVYGHDAKRGFCQTEHAIGLDTGCVYGRRLTACILPSREIVSVNSKYAYEKPPSS